MARKAADRVEAKTGAPRFVAGAIGPMPVTASISPDVNDPAFRAVNFDQLRQAYAEQVRALIEGGVDVLLVETIFDTLNCQGGDLRHRRRCSAELAARSAAHDLRARSPISAGAR